MASTLTFTVGVTLPNYTMGTGKWVIVRTNISDGSLPGTGVRMNSSYYSVLAKVLTSSASPAFATDSNANHYYFMGIEIGATSTNALNYGVFAIGNGETTLGTLPNNFTFDRCYIHGNTLSGGSYEVRRGILGNGASLALINSEVKDFHNNVDAGDPNAFLSTNGPGPFHIENNNLQATGENVMFGGTDPSITNLVPSDLFVVRNHFYKNPAWMGVYTEVKNIFELKNAQRVLVEGNIFEGNWAAAQGGTAILFTPRNANGVCTWCTVANVTFRYNQIIHVSSGFGMSGADTSNGSGPSQTAHHISIHDNLGQDWNTTTWNTGTAGDAKAFSINNAGAIDTHDISIVHNTWFQNDGSVATYLYSSSSGHSTSNFIEINNIGPHLNYGVNGDAMCCGTSTLNTYFPGSTFTANVLENNYNGVSYPAGNFTPSVWTTVLFVDNTNCQGGTYSISVCARQSGSPYHNAGTDGKDLGADMTTLGSKTNGVN